MPLSPDSELAKQLDELDSVHRFTHRRGVPDDHDLAPFRNGAGSVVVCEIADNKTGTTYAKAAGLDEDSALGAAVKKAAGAEKPMTAAQQAQRNIELDEELQKLRAENAQLRAQGKGKAPAKAGE